MRALPNILTISRIGLIPMLLLALYVAEHVGHWVAAAIFALALLTDYFDGALARNLEAQSSFGRIWDPIADKLLTASTLIMLVGFGKAPMLPALLIICREIVVSGLREYLAEFKVSIPVSRLAKVKTFLQFTAILLLIIGQEHEGDIIAIVYYLGEICLWVAAILTLMTGYTYLKEGFTKVEL
jgi:cardiolipin synthase